MAKMWAGRTAGNVDTIADDFNSSIRFDCRMYRQDITGSMAHAAMLAKQNIITEAEADALIDGLEDILNDLDNGTLQFDMTCEDIHMFVEQVLTQRIGDVGKKLHTARSRNDQVALDVRMYLLAEAGEMKDLLLELVANRFAELVYFGQWFTPLREALAAFVTETQKTVTGDVKLKLYKGNIINAGVTSPFSLYSEEIATFGESDYNQADAQGFINLFGLPITVQAMVDGKK